MPGHFKVYAEHRLAFLKFSGAAHIDDCFEIVSALIASPEWCSEYAIFIDNSGVTTYTGDFEDLQRFCGHLTDTGAFENPRMDVVYYAPSDLSFGIARMTQQVLGPRFPFRIHVYRDAGPALAKLGLEGTDLAKCSTFA
ncbi:hypothetical protein CEW88_07835 [Alloyangia pacifica]|uniref:Uncharacterized protein n=1 Tax=Alloyangia pacifica TaxID=311180 RepID=A0A2U8HFV6_9RHOB|nr:hypothetical protein [Alloyangia pacifica]AWI83595.1 hypothetical protein CEW88_07835 [Alloyangia pacifica]